MEEDLFARLSRELNLRPEQRAAYEGWEVRDGTLYPGREETVSAWEERGPRYSTALQIISELLEGEKDTRDQDLASYVAGFH